MSTPPITPGSPGGNVADLLRAAASAAGDRSAIIAPHVTRSWAELDCAVDVGCVTLARHGVGERVVLGLPTGVELAAALFAVLRAGLIAVPVDPARSDLAWVARRVGAVAIVTDEDVPTRAEVVSSAQVATWWAGEAQPQQARSGGERIAMLARAARAPAPVMLSHRAFLGAAAALRSAELLDLQPTDRILQLLPLFHVVGLVTAFLPAALAGAAVVIPDLAAADTPADAAVAAVRAHRVTILPAEPTLYRQLDRVPGYDRALATVRLMTSGSSPLDAADFALIRAATGQAVREGYGISESAATITSTLLTAAARPGSVGLPYPGVQVRIGYGSGVSGGDGDRAAGDGAAGDGAAGDGGDAAGTPGPQGGDGTLAPAGAPDATPDAGGNDPAATAEDASQLGMEPTPETAAQPPRAPVTGDGGTAGLVLSDDDDTSDQEEFDHGDVGPIAVRGDTLFSGYWPDGQDGPGPDGWFTTGDLGYIDDAGELHLVDRSSETVVVAGFTVYPREVEDMLVTHPYVADAAVVGVPGRAGATVVAALVAQPGTRPTPEDLDEFLDGKLAPFKVPTDYQIVDVLPRTEVGRLDREAVRRTYAAYRGIALDAPARLVAAAGPGLPGVRPPEAGTSERGAEDTDDDLF